MLVPSAASALTLTQVIGFFHLAVGLLLTATLIVFLSGVWLWVARFNTWPSHRDTAIRVMEWGVVMIFVLILMLGIVNYIQKYPSVTLPIIAFIIVVAVAILIVRNLAHKKKEAPPARPRR